ncbi:MAG: tRNA glutamyl-Q(34) synthetase GluQRS [Alphaproteobacteria bacterium]|jgi:glutamyl-Q tRNA(Asp) synthetase|nr:tRNA glutamyl-Q(34) synthetase GluQRS [Alphaproteobacteria bacterium]
MVVTRFAPSPNGPLHLGHAYAALFAHDAARRQGGRFLLRIEDIDQGRARPEFEAAILADLAWLGLDWETPVRRQSDHFADYARALERLEALGVVYPCFCTRKEIAAEVARSPSAPHGPEGPLYPGTCRGLPTPEVEARRDAGRAFALRLDIATARGLCDGALTWHDAERGRIEARPERLGDVVLARKDVPTSYHLAVTVDDHLQGVTLVTRGEDLVPATDVHRLLQGLLGYAVPDYHHHRLVQDPDGRRLAKRQGGGTLADLREAGVTPAEIRHRLGLD